MLLLGLVAVVAHFGEGREFAALLRGARPSWMLAALVLQTATYLCAGGVWQLALHTSGHHLSVWNLAPLGLAKLFTDQALPSAGLSGSLLVVRSLSRRGVPRTNAVAAMAVGIISYYAAYAIAIAAALAVLWGYGELHPAFIAIACGFGAVAAGVPLAIVWLRDRPGRALPAALLRVPGAREVIDAMLEAPRESLLGARLALETVVLQLAIFVLDAATLAVLARAVGAELAPDIAFASFVVASMVSTLAWIPGGLGPFEGTCIAMLHLHGLGLEAALAAVLLSRGFTFWLPMAPGLWIARLEMARPKDVQTD